MDTGKVVLDYEDIDVLDLIILFLDSIYEQLYIVIVCVIIIEVMMPLILELLSKYWVRHGANDIFNTKAYWGLLRSKWGDEYEEC